MIHADYPHEPGRLHDCAACEARCHCTGDSSHTPCVYCGINKITGFRAIINVPGYLPQDDEDHVFDTAREAWEWLRDERERDIDDCDYDEPEWDDDQALEEIDSMIDADTPGVVYGRMPGYSGKHDLGMAYSVVKINDLSGS